MMRMSRGKTIAILLISLIGCLIAVPSLMSEATRKTALGWLPAWVPQKAVSLGLDLQGGAHVLLEIDKADLTRSMVLQLRVGVWQLPSRVRFGRGRPQRRCAALAGQAPAGHCRIHQGLQGLRGKR